MLCSTIPTLCGATVRVIVTPDNKYICYVQPFQHCVAPLFMSLSHPITLQTNIYVMFNHSNTVWRHCSCHCQPDNKYACYVQPFQHCVAPLFMSLSHPITLQTNIYVMFNHSNTVWRHCSCHCHTR